MRNLKKILSLALALVMVFSLMTFASAADFGDADSVDHTEAANVLSALGVIQGYEDGNFYPDRVVKRGEMAKIIAFIVNGGKDPVLNPAEVSYNDTANHWAKGYIEYCTGLGIVSGYGDGSFKPEGTVTGTEAAKMLLIAMGYNSDIREYTGDNWSLNVGVDANLKGLYKDLTSVNPSNGLDRDATAQMVYNTLNAKGVYRSDSIGVQDGKVTYNYVDDNFTVMYRKMGVARVEGILVANEYADLNDTNGRRTAGKTDVVVTNFDELDTNVTVNNIILNITNNDNPSDKNFSLTATNTFSVSTGKDELGKAVVIFAKPAANSTSTDRAEVVASVIVDENNILESTERKSKATDLEKALRGAGLRTDLTRASYYINGNLQTVTSGSGSSAVTSNKAYSVGEAVNQNGYKIQFIDYDLDGIVDIVLADKVDFGKVTTKNTSGNGTITISTGASTITYRDSREVVGFDDVARGDYVLYSEAGGRLYLEKPETITGKLTDYSKQQSDNPGGSALWVDGTKIKNSGASGANCDGSKLTAPGSYGAGNLDKEATFYLDACGFIVAVDGTATSQYALATYANSKAFGGGITTDPRATTYFEDGTSGTPVYKDNDTTGFDAVFGSSGLEGSTGQNFAANVVLGSYTYNSDDELVLVANASKITSTTSSSTADGQKQFKYTSGNVLVEVDNQSSGLTYLKDAGGGNLYMTNSTVVFFVESKDNAAIASAQVGKVTVYNGKDSVPNIDLRASATSSYVISYIFDPLTNEIKAMAVVSGSISSVGSNYLYVIEVVSTSPTTKQVKVALDGEVKDITVESKDTQTVATGLNLYSIKDGKYTLSTNGVTGVISETVIDRKNENQRTIVVNGTEYKVLDTTDFAHIGDKVASSFEELRRNDKVTILTRTSGSMPEVLGVYIIETVEDEAPAKLEVPSTPPANGAAWDQFIRDQEDGAYIPPTGFSPTEGLSGNAADARVFKFTVKNNNAQSVTITVKNEAGVVVFQETNNNGGTPIPAKGQGFFYLTMGVPKNNTASSIAGTPWQTANSADRGTYYWTISETKAAADGGATVVVQSGSYVW